MNKLSYQRNTCRLCQSRNLKPVLSLTPTPVADAYIPSSKLKIKQPEFPLDLLLCKKCGNAQIHDVVNPKILYFNYLYESVSSLGFVTHFNDYAKEVIKKIKPPKSSFVIDVGSNDGSLLRAFKSNSMHVLGIDPARRIAKAATKSGIKTLPFFLTQKLASVIRKKYGPAEIICCNNLYANVDDLDDFTNSIKEMLTPSGVFIFETFYMPDTVKNMVFDFIEHEHLSYFTVAPLDRFFKKHGLELIDIQKVDTKGGSIRASVQFANGSHKISPAVKKFISFEKKIGIHTPLAFKSFEKRINKAKNDLLTLIKKLKKEGKAIVGYGASAQSTTFIYHFNLTDKLEFIADDYKRKHYTFSPGCHIPILPSSEIYKKKPDSIVIIAWRYAKPIIEKNKNYLKEGSTFIIPLPKLELIPPLSS